MCERRDGSGRSSVSGIKKVDINIVQLENAGYYPFEDPGLVQMAGDITKLLYERTRILVKSSTAGPEH
jgi:hypothetical protein